MSARQSKKRSKRSIKKSHKGKTWIPHGYQVRVVSKLITDKYKAVFLDPGLGKTTIMLWLYSILKHAGLSKGMLVVAPLNPCFLVWPKEIKKWSNFSGLSVCVLHPQWPISTRELNFRKDYDIYIINPEGLPWLLKQMKGMRRTKWPFDVLCVDESTKFKNMGTEKFKQLKRLIPGFARRYILTGTPVPRGLIDIQGQMFIVDQGQSFGWQKGHFREKYFRQVGRPEWAQFEIRKDREQDLYKKVAPFVIRLRAKDYLELPDRQNNFIWVDLPSKARKHYSEIETEMFTIIDENEIDTPTASSVNQKMHQIANGCIYKSEDPLVEKQKGPREFIQLHREKLEALENLVNELQGKPILIGYMFKHDLWTMQKYFGKKLKSLDGVSMKERIKLEAQWNEGKIQMLAAYPGTNALGLNLQECGQDVCWYSQIHDMEAYDQFIKRIERQGSKYTYIRNHHIVARETVDELKYAQMEGKLDQQATFFERVTYYGKLRRKASQC